MFKLPITDRSNSYAKNKPTVIECHYSPDPRVEGIMWCLSRTSGLTREQRGARKTKIGTEVAHVTRDSDTTFKVKRSKVNLQGRGHIVAALRTACLLCDGYNYGSSSIWRAFDARSTVYRRSLRSQCHNPLAAVTLNYLLI